MSDGYDFAAIEAEHATTPDRVLLLMTLQRSNETLAQLQRINGTVARLVKDLDGDPSALDLQPGLKRRTKTLADRLEAHQELHRSYRDRGAGFVAGIAAGSAFGGGSLALLASKLIS